MLQQSVPLVGVGSISRWGIVSRGLKPGFYDAQIHFQPRGGFEFVFKRPRQITFPGSEKPVAVFCEGSACPRYALLIAIILSALHDFTLSLRLTPLKSLTLWPG